MRKRYLALWGVFILLFATLCAGCAEQAPVPDENGRPSLETIPVTELPTEEPTEKPTEPHLCEGAETPLGKNEKGYAANADFKES